MNRLTWGQRPSQRRARFAMAAAMGGALLLIAGITATALDGARSRAPEAAGPVVPQWSERAREATRITVEGPLGAFSVLRGSDGVWRLPERAGYPADPAVIEQVDRALSEWTLERAMTRDPAKYERLGLGAPEEGGSGVRLTVFAGGDEPLADLWVGESEAGGAFVRAAGSARVYAVDGEPLEIGAPSDWMDLDFIDFDPRAMSRAEVRPESGPAYLIARAGTAMESFELRRPSNWRLLTGGAANGVGQAAARLRFRDVRPAADFTGEPVALHGAATFSGLGLTLSIHADGDRRWAIVEARALADDAAPRAEFLNDRLAGWAFLLSDDAHERLTRPLDAMAEPYGAG